MSLKITEKDVIRQEVKDFFYKDTITDEEVLNYLNIELGIALDNVKNIKKQIKIMGGIIEK